MARCVFVREGGGQCRCQALQGEALCFAHSPGRREVREAARREGGRNSARHTGQLNALQAQIGDAWQKLNAGHISPAQAQATALLVLADLALRRARRTAVRRAEA